MNFFKTWIQKHRTPLLGIGSTILFFIFLALLMDWLVMPLYTHRGSEDEVPDVTESSFTEATQNLTSRGFRIVKDGEVYSPTYPESTVVFQNPEPFSKVKRGRRVYVTLSAGVRKVLVPRVVSMSERDAEFILRQSGLVLGDITYEYNSYYPNGVVTDQSTPDGTEVETQTKVDITVSSGMSPDRFVVPDLIGKSLDSASKIIQRSGFRVGKITREVQKKLVPDTVIRQSLEPGEAAGQGQSIDLVVSRLEDKEWEE
jgi:beta-lactam-binding protein with PASTA domain